MNLLRHPNLARQSKVFHRCWSGLAGLLMGTALTGGWQHGLQTETVQLQEVQSRLQADWRARQLQAKEAEGQQTRLRRLSAQADLLGQVAEHQQAWLRLHDSLQQEASDRGLRLERLQSEAQTIELHGTMNRAEAVSEVRQSLSAQWPQPLALASMSAGTAQAVRFVWHARWPQTQSVVPPPAAAKKASGP